MIGILLVSHGKFAEELLNSAQMIMGSQENIKALALEPEDDPRVLKEKLYEASKKIDQGHGVVILVDLMGGSPGNAAAYLAKDGYPVITGMNLPMLLELVAMRNMGIEEVVNLIINLGRESIEDLRNLLRG